MEKEILFPILNHELEYESVSLSPNIAGKVKEEIGQNDPLESGKRKIINLRDQTVMVGFLYNESLYFFIKDGEKWKYSPPPFGPKTHHPLSVSKITFLIHLPIQQKILERENREEKDEIERDRGKGFSTWRTLK